MKQPARAASSRLLDSYSRSHPHALNFQVADLLHDLDDGMRPISVFFPYLPTAYHKKRDL